MRNTLRQVLHSSKFIVGFTVFFVMLAVMLIYPLLNPGSPLQSIGLGTFAKPGTYVSLYDSVGTEPRVFRLPEADGNRVAQLLSMEDRVKMVHYMELAGADLSVLDITDTEALIENWHAYFDASLRPQGMTKAERNYYSRLDTRLNEAAGGRKLTVLEKNIAGGDAVEKSSITKDDYININDVANVKTLPLGTDNFGRDVLKQLVSAAGTSLIIGLSQAQSQPSSGSSSACWQATWAG